MLGIHQVIETLIRMEAEGIVQRYAIGGAVGATFYLEPVATLDVDVFVAFGTSPGALISLEPIFGYLQSRGSRVEGEYIHAKDKARLLHFIESGALDADRLKAILARHDVADNWQHFVQRFLTDES